MPVNVDEAVVVVAVRAADDRSGDAAPYAAGDAAGAGDGAVVGAVVAGPVVGVAEARTSSTGCESVPHEASSWTFWWVKCTRRPCPTGSLDTWAGRVPTL